MNKPILGGAIFLMLIVTAVGIIFDIPMYYWLPALVVIIVFGGAFARRDTEVDTPGNSG